ncbi:MAG: class I SAM-dependent methyltransferase [Alphaproteobacteria bacterium]|nr:class I SAM-dependent methyltransferase [Alphaproteobacteria bacterium]
MLGQLDNSLQRIFGLPYLFASRDFNIHSRCRYLLYRLAALQGRELSLLDVGCGAGITLRHLAKTAPGKIRRYVGIDRLAERLHARYQDIKDIDVAFHNVDLDDAWDVGRFDVVWCSEVIEHLIDDAGQIAKLKQAARPGGTVLITTPCLDFVRHVGTLFPPILETSAVQDGGHVRHGYHIDDIRRLAAEAGLVVESIDGVNRLTLAETEKRYTTSGASWIANNVKMSWRARGQRDFAIGQAFEAEPERYASIGAMLARPALPVRMRAQPETIEAPLPKGVATDTVHSEVLASDS